MQSFIGWSVYSCLTRCEHQINPSTTFFPHDTRKSSDLAVKLSLMLSQPISTEWSNEFSLFLPRCIIPFDSFCRANIYSGWRSDCSHCGARDDRNWAIEAEAKKCVFIKFNVFMFSGFLLALRWLDAASVSHFLSRSALCVFMLCLS